jgi:hypothetical protein
MLLKIHGFLIHGLDFHLSCISKQVGIFSQILLLYSLSFLLWNPKCY